MIPKICGRPLFSYAGSVEYGIWWFRICGWGLSLRASWNEPLFSERHGYKRKLVGAFGWRLLWIERNHGYAALSL